MAWGFKSQRDVRRVSRATVQVEQQRRGAPKTKDGSPQAPGAGGIHFCRFQLTQQLTQLDVAGAGTIVFASNGDTGSIAVYNAPTPDGNYLFAGNSGDAGYALLNTRSAELDPTYGDKWYIILLPCPAD